MGFLDKAKESALKAKEAAEKSVAEASEKNKERKAAEAEAKKPLDGCIQWYEVWYRGGLLQYSQEMTKSSKGTIGLNIMPDAFYFKPLLKTEDWFEPIEIKYSQVKKFEIVKRTVGNAEMLMAGNATDAANLATLNTMAITYDDEKGDEIYLKMEMCTGFSVQGQAKKCEEMMDVLRSNQILKLLNKEEQGAGGQQLSSADELKKYKDLLEAGILSQEEFDAKKKQLLGL